MKRTHTSVTTGSRKSGPSLLLLFTGGGQGSATVLTCALLLVDAVTPILARDWGRSKPSSLIHTAEQQCIIQIHPCHPPDGTSGGPFQSKSQALKWGLSFCHCHPSTYTCPVHAQIPGASTQKALMGTGWMDGEMGGWVGGWIERKKVG